MTVQIEKRYYTPEEYLKLEEIAKDKHEYRDGEIIPMTGATTNHILIAGNFYQQFPTTINNENYWIFMSDVRLWMSTYRIYTYPDVMIIKNQPIYEGKGTNNAPYLMLSLETVS